MGSTSATWSAPITLQAGACAASRHSARPAQRARAGIVSRSPCRHRLGKHDCAGVVDRRGVVLHNTHVPGCRREVRGVRAVHLWAHATLRTAHAPAAPPGASPPWRCTRSPPPPMTPAPPGGPAASQSPRASRPCARKWVNELLPSPRPSHDHRGQSAPAPRTGWCRQTPPRRGSRCTRGRPAAASRSAPRCPGATSPETRASAGQEPRQAPTGKRVSMRERSSALLHGRARSHRDHPRAHAPGGCQ